MSDQVASTDAEPDAEEQRRRQIEFNQPAIELLRSWLEDESESVEEQREALEMLMRAIDEDRGSGRKLFQHLLIPDEPNRRLG
jgi:predicted RNase H-like nuclease (RuvC/YqgF family)